MEIVTDDRPATVDRADAVRVLHEMAAVVRTIFAVDAVPVPVAPSSGGATPGLGTPPVAAAPAVAPPPRVPAASEPPASLPVPGAAILQEIAFLDDRP